VKTQRIARLALVATLVLTAAALALLTAGCETLASTTLAENRGAYFDAREFLAVGRTPREQVRAKYGKPGKVTPLDGGGEHWEYRRRETVFMDAYADTPMAADGFRTRPLGGYQHTIERTTRLELFFDAQGILAHYRLDRGMQ
jgi:outer membrane protein assembly factor BamE (lipoprotein component of BamABCDE complex)